MDNKTINPIKVENAKIIFRNFSGKADKFNPMGGNRQFCLIIEDPDFAKQLEEDGWNIKYLRPRDEDEEPQPYLPVKVKYANRPPHIYLCTSNNKTLLNEETVGSLDYADISNVDLIVTPYQYSVQVTGKSGVAAYVKTMYVTVVEDEFAAKYEMGN